MVDFLRSRLDDEPPQVLNWRLWFAVAVFALLGTSHGFDEGLIGTSATQPSFRSRFGLDDHSKTPEELTSRLSNITAMLHLGCILGAIVSCYLTDKLGRLWAARQICFLWVFGVSLFLGSGVSGNIAMLYAGRFIAGIGVGQTAVVAPAYLAEIAPRAVRGLCVTMYSGAVYIGVMLGYFSSYGTLLHISGTNQAQWMVPNSIQLAFALFIFVCTFIVPESPRWLMKKGRERDAARALESLRGIPAETGFIQSELAGMRESVQRAKESAQGRTLISLTLDLFRYTSNRYRLMLSVLSQLLGQWSGASSITMYAPQYFAMLGIASRKRQMLATAMFGVVKFISVIICSLCLVDRLGRKRALMSGISIQAFAMLYMAVFLMTSQRAVEAAAVQNSAQKRAAAGAVSMIYICGFGYGLGWHSLQYLISSEIYPIQLRAIGLSIVMTIHFVNQYGTSKAVPHMVLAMTGGGTMMFFAAITILGVFWAMFFLPELAGMPLESIERVFELPWYRIGLFGHRIGPTDKMPDQEQRGGILSEPQSPEADRTLPEEYKPR